MLSVPLAFFLHQQRCYRKRLRREYTERLQHWKCSGHNVPPPSPITIDVFSVDSDEVDWGEEEFAVIE
uniref:Uncharacterized protein n=1 Tax=viral metagenome TaxID=1070528 RepID=A0A6C0BM50_9ZZZZ